MSRLIFGFGNFMIRRLFFISKQLKRQSFRTLIANGIIFMTFHWPYGLFFAVIEIELFRPFHDLTSMSSTASIF